MPALCGKVLSAFVRNGGGLLLFVGEGVSANRYNAEFRDLLPVQLDRVERRTSAGWHIENFEKSSPIFAAFQGPSATSLTLPEFTGRFSLRPSENNWIAANLDDGTPLIVGKTFGSGRVVLVNTSADTSWSDWPKHKAFVPWLHSVTDFLASRSTADTMQPAPSFVTGEEAEITLGPAWKNRSLVLQWPGAKEKPIKTDEDGRLQNLNLAAPGIYVVRDQAQEIRRWAVNVPVQESDLSAFSPKEIAKQISRKPQTARIESNLFSIGVVAQGTRELWRVLLITVLVLLFVEVLLANRTTG